MSMFVVDKKIIYKTVFAVVVLLPAVFLAGCGRRESAASRPAPSAGLPAVASSGAAGFGAQAAASPVTIYAPPLQPAAPAYDAAPQAAWNGAGRTVILDAGHGGHDTGTSHYGLNEKDVNLDLTLRTAALLRARGCNVVLTRSSDAFVPLAERSAVANRHPNATFVSIHVNAAEGNPGASGIETFVLSSEFSDQDRGRAAAERFRAQGMDAAQGRQALANLAVQSRSRGKLLASSLQQSLCVRMGGPDRGVKQKNLAVLRETYFGPAALVEVGFLTNPRTAVMMRSDEWRRRTSEALAEGIGNFLRQL